ncbi:Gfo/Idh/MocA family oxidoreductase [Synechococcus sp. MU1644]|nr:Gfo/Idh/MocA family oxidoreductase [Synechococcus sp. MU1644]
MAILKTGLIGAGVFGGYHAGKIAASERTEFVGLFDPDAARCADLAAKQGVEAFASQAKLFAAVDAVIVACPATYHEAVVRSALEAGCHVMVEKPLALTGHAADQLASLADDKGLTLQVGHQERFVLEAMGLFDIPETPTRIEAWRMGPPAPDGRAGDVSVIWDLMTHDLDMVGKLMGPALTVEATGRSAHTDHIDESTAMLSFAIGQAEVTASRCHSERDRRMVLTYPSGSIAINFLTREIDNSTPFEIKVDVSDSLPDPLGAADEAFFAAALGERACAVPGHEAALAVHMAEQAELSALHTIGA